MRSNEEYIECLKKLVGIKSVTERNGAGYPFGKGPSDALHYVLDLCETLGFRIKNQGNRYGFAEIGAGEELIGILVHLDVVEEGTGWDYPPYQCGINDGKIYGRGVTDDKGPAMAVIYAMKDLLDAGIVINKRIRIIFGLAEETGDWTDIEEYKRAEEIPDYGFTPDGYFPCIYGEKGILQVEILYTDKKGLISINGGIAENVVPDRCSARILLDNGETADISVAGKSAHASVPQEGVNAISKIMEKIASLPCECPFADFYMKLFGLSYNGQHCGCAFEDRESGKLTCNVGKVCMDETGIRIALDIRYPVTVSAEQVLRHLKSEVEPCHASVKTVMQMDPVYMEKNGKLIRMLEEVFEKETGMKEESLVIGGGTYARAMEHIVAFGPLIPGREQTEHQANEYMLVDDYLLLKKIYRGALLAMLREVEL